MSITDNFPPAEKSSSDVGEIERKMLMASSETYLLYCATTSQQPRSSGDLLPPLDTNFLERTSTASHVLPQLAFFFTTFQVPNMLLTLQLKPSLMSFWQVRPQQYTCSKYWYG